MPSSPFDSTDPVSNIEPSTGVDGQSQRNGTVVDGQLWMFNGASWDRWYNNNQGTLWASAARTVTVSSPVMSNPNARGLLVFLNVTVASGTGGLIVRIQALDPVSGGVFSMNVAPTAVIATGLTVYGLYPSISTGLTQATSGVLPRVWQVTATVGDASSYTHSAGYSLIL